MYFLNIVDMACLRIRLLNFSQIYYSSDCSIFPFGNISRMIILTILVLGHKILALLIFGT